MHRPEPHRRRAAVDVVPVVVGVRDAEVARVLVDVAVRVADQGAFPLNGGVSTEHR